MCPVDTIVSRKLLLFCPGISELSQDPRELVRESPSVHFLQLAEKLLFLHAAGEVGEAVQSHKLVRLSPIWSHGRWVTHGRLGKGRFKVLGALIT